MLEDALIEFEKTYQRKSFTGDSTTNGITAPQYTAFSEIQAVIQPLNENELRNVPEGQNQLDWKKIWSRSILYNKDVVVYQGNEYELQKTTIWDETPYYFSKMVRVED